MIVVAIIALLASIAVPGFLRARKRAQASRIINDLRLIDSRGRPICDRNNKVGGANSTVAIATWTAYMKQGTNLYITGADIFGNTYGPQTVDRFPRRPSLTHRTLCPT